MTPAACSARSPHPGGELGHPPPADDTSPNKSNGVCQLGAEIVTARGATPAGAESTLRDILAPGLAVVFCGINPGRVSAAAGAHFANPRNDFWRLLHDAGLTPRLLRPEEQWELPRFGYGITNAASRTTAGSGDLRRADFAGAAERLRWFRALNAEVTGTPAPSG